MLLLRQATFCRFVMEQEAPMFAAMPRLVTLAELAKMLGGRGDQSKLDPDRQPICLLLGGGMAAGKSTVRNIIGKAEFWTRVRISPILWGKGRQGEGGGGQ